MRIVITIGITMISTILGTTILCLPFGDDPPIAVAFAVSLAAGIYAGKRFGATLEYKPPRRRERAEPRSTPNATSFADRLSRFVAGRKNSGADHDWMLWWEARLAAIESVLGKSHDSVGHGTIPFNHGADLGGTADIVYFHSHADGIVSVTAELIGNPNQISNSMGNYELAICCRDGDNWGPNIIGQLAHYTLETPLEPGQTMDIGPASPDGSTIDAFLFFDYGRFHVRNQDAGILMCVGITASELTACRNGDRERVASLLKLSGVYPFTDLKRDSVV